MTVGLSPGYPFQIGSQDDSIVSSMYCGGGCDDRVGQYPEVNKRGPLTTRSYSESGNLTLMVLLALAHPGTGERPPQIVKFPLISSLLIVFLM